jgi:hypothetical protein
MPIAPNELPCLTIPSDIPIDAQLVHKYRVYSAGTATTSEPINPENRERFLEEILTTRARAA